MSSATEEVSLVKAKAGGLQTRVQVCLIVGQERPASCKHFFLDFTAKGSHQSPPVCADSITCFTHSLLLQQTQKGFLHPTPLHLLPVLWYFQSLLHVVFVIMNTKLRNLCLLQHSHLLLKSRFFVIWEQDSCCWLQEKQ